MRYFNIILIVLIFISNTLTFECYGKTSSILPNEWAVLSQKDRGDHYVADVLVAKDKNKEYFIDMFKSISKALGSKTTVIRVYTSKKAYTNIQQDKWDDVTKSEYIIYYVKGSSSNEIRWMAEKGKFGALFGTKTKIK